MEIFCPVIWQEGELNADFLRQAIETVLYEIKEF
jgi:hypothetical protein